MTVPWRPPSDPPPAAAGVDQLGLQGDQLLLVEDPAEDAVAVGADGGDHAVDVGEADPSGAVAAIPQSYGAAGGRCPARSTAGRRPGRGRRRRVPRAPYHAPMTEHTRTDPSAEPLVGIKPRSYEVTDGPTRAPARPCCGRGDDRRRLGQAPDRRGLLVERGDALQHAAARLAQRSKLGVREAGGYPLEFVTIAVSDGISMGHEGMRASLVSREVIADSVETVMHAERFRRHGHLAGCDKSLPGMLMAAARLNCRASSSTPGRSCRGAWPTGRWTSPRCSRPSGPTPWTPSRTRS